MHCLIFFFQLLQNIHVLYTTSYCQLGGVVVPIKWEYGYSYSDLQLSQCIRAHAAFEKGRYKRAARTAAAELSRAYLEAVSHALLARRRGMRFRNRQARYDEPPSELETESEYLFPSDTTIYTAKVIITGIPANKLKKLCWPIINTTTQ